MRRLLLLVLVLAALGCDTVPKTQYDAAVANAQKAKADADAQVAAAKSAMQAEIDALKTKLAEAEGKASATGEATRAELDELRKQKAAAEERLKLFEDFIAKLKGMIDTGKLEITVRRGQIVLALATDVLFDTGKTDIKPEGKTALGEIAGALKSVSGRRFQVAGHTDNIPIKKADFPSNWELSTARAVAVVKLLIEKGVRPEALSAAGYAQYDPSQSNATDKGRAKNRRIEIVLVPNVEDLVKMPDLGSKKAAQQATPPPATPPPATPSSATPPPAPAPAAH